MSAEWSAADEQTLRSLWGTAMSASKIGEHMGRNRNAIIGKAHRLKLPPIPKRGPARGKTYKPRQARKAPRVKLVRVICAKPVDDGINAAKTRFEIAPCQPPFMVGIMDISDAKCRFPIGHPKEPGFGFCGHPPISDSPYCAGHHALCYLPPQERRKAA